MSIEKIEIDNLSDYIADRGGVLDRAGLSGGAMPGDSGPSLLAQALGTELPRAPQNDIASLVKPAQPLPGRKMGA